MTSTTTRRDGTPTMRRLRELMAQHLPAITWHRQGGGWVTTAHLPEGCAICDAMHWTVRTERDVMATHLTAIGVLRHSYDAHSGDSVLVEG